jgi:hypothetical protein
MSDTPVPVSSDIQGAPDPSQPPQQAAAPAQADSAAPPQASPAPAPADNPETHGWRAVLKGALTALGQHIKGAGEGALAGGLPGAIVGAASPKLADQAMQFQQQSRKNNLDAQAAKIKFADAEAASQMADAHMRDVQREQMPEELKLRRDELEQKIAQMYISMGVMPKAVAENTTDGAHAGAQQLQDANGGAVPAMVYLHVGDHHLAFDPNDLAANAGVLKQVNDYQRIVGGQQIPSTLMLQKQPNKTQLVQSASTIYSPTPVGAAKANQQIQQYQGYINTVSAWPDDTPDKKEVLGKLKDAQKLLVDARTADVKQQSDLAQARGAAAQNAKAIAVIDPATNRSILVDAKTAKAQQMTPAGEGAKLEAKAAQLQDMQVGSQNARTAIDGLRTKINPATLVQIQAALKSGDEGYIENIKRNLFNQNLSPDVNQYITAVLNLQERALSLRSLGGQGQGSEAQRNAIVRLLPTVADLSNKQLMKSKLDAFDQQVGIYYKNLPKVNVKGTAASPAGQQDAPKTGMVFGVQKSTGKRVQSSDGGKTWQLAQ